MYLCLFPFTWKLFKLKYMKCMKTSMSLLNLFFQGQIYFLKSCFLCPHFKTLHNSIQTPLNHCILTLIGM